MTRKQATIAVRSGLNDDEQYGCVVPPIHLSSTYNFTGQPLPDDADLRKERSDEIPEAAKEIMREMGINPETWEY